MSVPYRQLPKVKQPLPPLQSEAPYVSYWVHPTNGPQVRRKAREIKISGGAVESVSEAPYVAYWKQPTNEEQRKSHAAKISRQQPQYPLKPQWIQATGEANVTASAWQEPTNEPLSARFYTKRRLQFDEVQPPLPAIPSEAPYVSYWKQLTNEPLRYRHQTRIQSYGQFWAIDIDRVPPPLAGYIQDTNQLQRNNYRKRQQPAPEWVSPYPIPYVSDWLRFVNEPRIVKRRQQPSIIDIFWADNIPATATLVSQWYRTPTLPVRRKVKEIDISGGAVESITEAPYVSYWIQRTNQLHRNNLKKRPQILEPWNPWVATQTVVTPLMSQWYKPVNEPLRSRVPKRAQPRYSIQSMPPVGSEAPYVSYWAKPVNQPVRQKKRPQPRYFGGYWITPDGLVSPPFTSWKQPTAQPLRRTKRSQLRYPGQFLTEAEGEVVPPYETWLRPKSQPVRRTKRQQPAKSGTSRQSSAPFIRHIDQPLRVKVVRRQQPSPVFDAWYATRPTTNILVSEWRRQPTDMPRRRQTGRYMTLRGVLSIASIATNFMVTIPITLHQRGDSTTSLGANPNNVMLTSNQESAQISQGESANPLTAKTNDNTLHLG